ncbi:MAG: Ubiquinone biosynthesis monooxygenase UbiB [Frankiales bacterium]|nr:Ubiquinone biosynthesis monooxygenase UbiB [Frankiales bacterium]
MQTSGFVRTARLLSLPLGAVGLRVEGLSRRLTGEDPERLRAALRRRNAARTRRVLGDLKGGALKAGQLLSTVEALFPQDPEGTWREALVGLQESNAGLPFAEVEPVLRAELGPRWRGRFSDFDEQHAAAASLGQVHRATWAADGRAVAVKVQYPGVREALTADLRTLSALSRATAVVARGMALPPLVAEMQTRLVEELDYLHEAASQERFAAGYADDADVLVPRVVLAAPRVLVMDWVGGIPLTEVAATDSQPDRDRAALLYQRFLVSGPERAGLLHTDPHPGNFRYVDGQLGVLDFGSTLALPGMPATFGRLIAALLDRDPDLVLQRLQEEGFVRPGVRLDVEKLVDYMAPFSEPARHEEFTFSREWLRSEFARANDPRDPDFGVAMKLTLPAEHLFTHRVWLGMVGVLCQLEATVPVRPVLRRWLPGFDDGSRPLVGSSG